jgi:hypothetical protein
LSKSGDAQQANKRRRSETGREEEEKESTLALVRASEGT